MLVRRLPLLFPDDTFQGLWWIAADSESGIQKILL